MEQVDVAIVGGGSAGISAARRLIALGRSVLLIEALPRLGGRARSETIGGYPLDLGCGWLHSAERNPLARLAAERGIAIDHSEAAWEKTLPNRLYSTDAQHRGWEAYDALIERMHRDPPASDCAGDAMPRDDRWRPTVDAISSYINGTELDTLSIADFLAYDDAASEKNWRLPGGYGTFIAELGSEVPHSLDTPVGAVRHEAGGVRIETARGPVTAGAAIVTVSTTILARGAIRFEPAADEQLHAASQIPLGLADKVFLSLAKPDLIPPESHLLGRIDRAETGSYYMRPFGRPLIECFLGGANARALEDEAAVAFAIEELRALLGGEVADALAPLAVTRWAHAPTIGGSYSHALPGQAGARAVLARPVSERLCFAGEACSATDYSTAHGAWESGIAAADLIADTLP